LLHLAPAGVSHLKGVIFFDCHVFLHGPYAAAGGPSLLRSSADVSHRIIANSLTVKR